MSKSDLHGPAAEPAEQTSRPEVLVTTGAIAVAPATSTLPQAYLRYFKPLLALIFAITFLKGFRMPNAWAATHYAFNYSQGFIRRGLVGELARQLGGEHAFHYNRFALFAFVVMLLVAIGLTLLIRRMLRADSPAPTDPGLACALLAFAASPGLMFFVHIVGYLDYIGLLLLLVFVLVAARGRTLIMFLALPPIGLIYAGIHEGLAIMFGPTMLLAMVCHLVERARRGQISRRMSGVLIGTAIASTALLLAVSMLVSTLGTKPPEQIHALQAALTPMVDFPLRADAFHALYRSAKENLLTLMPGYWALPHARYEAKRAFFVTLPGLAFLLYYGLHLVRRTDTTARMRVLLGLLFVGASLSPLPFYFVGWDYARWNGLAVIASFCSIGALKSVLSPSVEKSERSASPTSPGAVALGLAAVALGLASENTLFDGFAVQYYPFDRQVMFVRDLFEQDFAYRPRM